MTRPSGCWLADRMSESLIIQRALRVPLSDGPAGDGATAARQLDSALLTVGFTLSGPLLAHLSGVASAGEVAGRVLAAVRELVGAHVRHNTYFLDFPANVPDTLEFWAECLRDAGHPGGEVVNLLDLPRYGRYQHTYRELLAAHDDAIRDLISVIDGFKAYYLVKTGEGTTSINLFEDQAGAEESNRAAAAWLAETFPDMEVAAPHVTAGETVIDF